MKIYIAGPMRGYPDLNFPAFNDTAANLRAQGHEVFNPAEQGDIPIREALAVDLQWICLHAEAVALLPGWEASSGAQAEAATADAVGIPTFLTNPPVVYMYPRTTVLDVKLS
jgi:hypothetical protein